jgi:hypothetical protein
MHSARNSTQHAVVVVAATVVVGGIESEHVIVAFPHVHPSASRQNLAFEIVVQTNGAVVVVVAATVVVVDALGGEQ